MAGEHLHYQALRTPHEAVKGEVMSSRGPRCMHTPACQPHTSAHAAAMD